MGHLACTVRKRLDRAHGVDFLYRDFRKGWKRSIELSGEDDLYRQGYCGCIFSEFSRYGPDD